jgi:SAM-dependent methyltransferase
MTQAPEWFLSWFDTPYYHILYKHRDRTEARQFIDALFTLLNPKKDDLILDLACGRGRHAIYMNQKGFNVVGYDLAEESINFAKRFANKQLHFEVRDMRENLGNAQFDFVFNLFTSFGYFNKREDDILALKAIANCLKPGGILVLDFMNAEKVAKRLVPKEHKNAGGIDFYIERYTTEKHIVKEIKFVAEEKEWCFKEEVQLLTKADFEEFIDLANLKLVAHFGSLDLQPFNAAHSDRLILLAQKI